METGHIVFYVFSFAFCIFMIWYGLKRDAERKEIKRKVEEMEKKV